MSLLITSSQSKVNTNSIGIEDPSQYTNHLRGSLQIKPNSQIAVDSVKINRNPVIDYSDGSNTLFWFGERLDTSVSRTGALPKTTSWPISQENLIRSSVGVQEFIGGFRKMIKEAYCYHPEVNTSSTQNGSLMSKDVGTTISVLEGFKFQFQQNTGAPTNLIPPDGMEQNLYGGTAPDYNGTNGCMTSTDTDQCLLFACEGDGSGPISLNNGSVTFNVSLTGNGVNTPEGRATRQFVVGLTRAYDYKKGTIADIMNGTGSSIKLRQNKGLGQDNDTAWDYAAEGKDGVLKLYHLVRRFDKSKGDITGAMKEIVYYSKTTPNNASNSSFATASPINVSEVTALTFNCKNEILTVTDQAGKVIVTVNKSDSADFKNTIPKPINQSCWKMYPQMYLFDDEREVAITEYHQRTGTTMDTNVFFGLGDWGARCTNDYFTAAEGVQKQSDIRPWVNSRTWPFRLEKRPWMSFSANTGTIQSDIVPKNPYKGVSGNLMADFENIFIVGYNKAYLFPMGLNNWAGAPNSARQLGMDPYTIFPPVASISSTVGSSFTSEVPETSSQSSAFIRLPRFGHTTYNTGKGSVSKIVSMIPRFDNAGNESGALFFKESDRLYVDLNNTEPINVTDITVDLVRRDETFVEDLTGSTEIVFHVREKPRL